MYQCWLLLGLINEMLKLKKAFPPEIVEVGWKIFNQASARIFHRPAGVCGFHAHQAALSTWYLTLRHVCGCFSEGSLCRRCFFSHIEVGVTLHGSWPTDNLDVKFKRAAFSSIVFQNEHDCLYKTVGEQSIIHSAPRWSSTRPCVTRSKCLWCLAEG